MPHIVLETGGLFIPTSPPPACVCEIRDSPQGFFGGETGLNCNLPPIHTLLPSKMGRNKEDTAVDTQERYKL